MTNTATKKPTGARLSRASGKRSDAARREGPPQPYPGRKARQGRIILNTPERRAIFIGGLVALVLFAIVAMLLGL